MGRCRVVVTDRLGVGIDRDARRGRHGSAALRKGDDEDKTRMEEMLPQCEQFQRMNRGGVHSPMVGTDRSRGVRGMVQRRRLRVGVLTDGA